VFVALGIQHAMHMHSIILPYVACLALQYFSTLSHKLHDFLFSLQVMSETFIILRRIERDMIKDYIGLHVKYLLF
jgi:hypothetical protein